MNNIRNFRERFGLTQEDLAKVLGCTRGAVCHYETGRRGMDINLCRAFINAFKEYGYELTIDDLFSTKGCVSNTTSNNGHSSYVAEKRTPDNKSTTGLCASAHSHN